MQLWYRKKTSPPLEHYRDEKQQALISQTPVPQLSQQTHAHTQNKHKFYNDRWCNINRASDNVGMTTQIGARHAVEEVPEVHVDTIRFPQHAHPMPPLPLDLLRELQLSNLRAHPFFRNVSVEKAGADSWSGPMCRVKVLTHCCHVSSGRAVFHVPIKILPGTDPCREDPNKQFLIV